MTKSPGTRTRTPSAGMEGALLASALDILESDGPDGLSVRRIAAAAGVAPMGVYNHFESKFGIVEALFVQGFHRLGTEMAALIAIAPKSDQTNGDCGLHLCQSSMASIAFNSKTEPHMGITLHHCGDQRSGVA